MSVFQYFQIEDKCYSCIDLLDTRYNLQTWTYTAV